ncbi:glycosyltransferase family 2 protein [uncultured Dokdonia sp.]|uniref:glycosyltransferase family 2 protein n=1 Tax=uncultured Dokdonia sp. TaxID=575653 RepID=UPI00262A8A11|nr:glycosyltransferase family 2 protein [uncultured Dokdonia sp.]
MQDFLTVVLPNRNRDLRLVVKSIDSIYSQIEENVKLILVDYGSPLAYQKELKNVCGKFSKLQIILYQTQGQLWNKSIIINSVLKHCTTEYFMVSDIDMIWHPNFLRAVSSFLKNAKTIYFPVGFMPEGESELNKSFDEVIIKGVSGVEATGITIFPTEHIKSIGGFDEFYHGWGGEDTDVHLRLQRAGYDVEFIKDSMYFKHQWHSKVYRNIKSKYPFAETLELINGQYLNRVKKGIAVKANHLGEVGVVPEPYDLNMPEVSIDVYATRDQVFSALYYMDNYKEHRVFLKVCLHPERKDIVKKMKRKLRNKSINFISILEVNNIVLEWIVFKARNSYYDYKLIGEHTVALELHYR